MAYGFAILSLCVCVLSPFIIYVLMNIASTFADISLLLVDRNVFPKVRAVAASVQHLRNTHFPDLVMLTLQQLCEAVKKRGVAGWQRGKQILGGQFWPAPITIRIYYYLDPYLHSERQEAWDVLSHYL